MSHVARLLLGAALVVTGAAAAEPPRFFLMGDGTVSLVNAHTDERGTVHYRRPDGTYDFAALATVRHLFRSRGAGAETEVSLRLVEVLSRLQRTAKVRELVLMSGYRSPDYNQDLKQQGRQVAGGSLHTEGLAADVAFPRPLLRSLWMQVRNLDCCGVGFYAKEGFLHVDVGRPRFWEATTSRVDENLSAGNARLFARTEYDRYECGESITVRLHALTVPPVRISHTAQVVPEKGTVLAAIVDGDEPERDGCLEIGASGGKVRLVGVDAAVRGHVELHTCGPRSEKTPDTVETNPIEIR